MQSGCHRLNPMGIKSEPRRPVPCGMGCLFWFAAEGSAISEKRGERFPFARRIIRYTSAMLTITGQPSGGMESRGRGALSGSPSSGSFFAPFLSKERKGGPVRPEDRTGEEKRTGNPMEQSEKDPQHPGACEARPYTRKGESSCGMSTAQRKKE
jgi:hypothetical protein